MMKKTTLILIILFALVTIIETSCSKSCICEYNSTDSNPSKPDGSLAAVSSKEECSEWFSAKQKEDSTITRCNWE